MKPYVVNMTMKVVYDDDHVDFAQVEAKANGETPLIAADKCFKKNKRAYDNVSSVVDVIMFEYEANEITHHPSNDPDETDERRSIGFWGNFILKTVSTIEAWVWIDGLVIAAIYLLWYVLHAIKGDRISETTDVHVIATVIGSILIPVAFSIVTRTILSLFRLRGLNKRTGWFMTGVSSIVAMTIATAVNGVVCCMCLEAIF